MSAKVLLMNHLPPLHVVAGPPKEHMSIGAN
eukprot:CAMPEP_0181484310 /NCGR_PEP_ID=MMETSP1110-20121109/45915_1 /TAXON_ID=174948 /ORGANISM="Symbiodinium sp., Strain CCMP421" /LENGTH=30 /DNA_ID= /DNA_START= /DNA_END= /DNA_ORIENTATION=